MSDNKHRFQKLTPVRDAEIGIYSDALDFVFENSDIKNVAISGAYSAGKSSVLESYKAAHADKTFLHISLTHFQSVGGDEDTEQKSMAAPTPIKETVLEGKILNQLIHQIEVNRIPQTGFRIKQETSRGKMVLWTITAMAFMLALFHIFFFNKWQNHIGHISTDWIRNIFSLAAKNSSVILSGVFCVILAAFFLYHIIKTQVNKGVFKKISADKLSIEIFEGSDESYFDKCLNEVLYLFDKCGADVIVFEDMDRYNANLTFEKLREVNRLTNNGRIRKRNSKPLRFFYLLRDDIFVSKDRTKFFDFIIPIVPIVDSSNSYDQLINHLKESDVYNLFEEAFLQGLSLYIDDMRILKNICNEFLIYNSRLNTTELSHNKLLAIIAYKNIFPCDFNELQLGRGFIFTLFDKKEQFIADKIAQLELELKTAKIKLESINNEHLKNNEELALVIKNERDKVNNSMLPYSKKGGELQKIEQSFRTRKEAIESRNAVHILTLEDSIRLLGEVIEKTKNAALQDIITRENIYEVFSVTSENEVGKKIYFNDVKASDYFALLKYLIRNGYIDESYTDYMTYFYEHSLSRTDKIFLRSVSDQIKKASSYRLIDPLKVFLRLNTTNFDQPEVLNYDLLFFLIDLCAVKENALHYPSDLPSFPNIKDSKNKENRCLMAMLEQILNSRVYFFLQGVFSEVQDNRLNYLVNLLNSERKDCLANILLDKVEFNVNQCYDFVFRTLIVTPDRDLMTDNVLKNALSEYISNHPKFLDKDGFDEVSLQSKFGKSIKRTPLLVSFHSRFKLLQVRFCSIDSNTDDPLLFEAVYKDCLYELTYENIAHLLNVKYSLQNSDIIKHKNYTMVRMQPDSPLAGYVEEKIDVYITEVLAHCDKLILDDETKVVSLLNNVNISDENKTAYINVLATSVKTLDDITEKSLWKQLIILNLAAHTEENVLDFFIHCNNIITEDLVRFINSDTHEYDFSNCNKQYNEETLYVFFDSVVLCNQLSDYHYNRFLVTLGYHYEETTFSIKGIPQAKMDIIIINNIIRIGDRNLLFVRENYPDNLIRFAVTNIESYCEIVVAGRIRYEPDEVLELLKEDISDKHKLKLLSELKGEMTAINPAYTDAVKAYILNYNFLEDDFQFFVTHYKDEGPKTKAAIIIQVVVWLKLSHEEPPPMSAELFEDIISSKVTDDNKITLLSYFLPSLNEKQCKRYLGLLRLIDFLSLFDRKRPRIIINDNNTRILETFQKNEWITKFEKENGTHYRAYGRMSHMNDEE